MYTIKFNTGRLYSAHGQRVVATYLPDERKVHFQDLDRMIAGAISTEDRPFASLEPHPALLAHFVMEMYDKGEYAMEMDFPHSLETAIDAGTQHI